MTTEPITPKPKRRWFQYSLRTLMVLMLAFGCGFGWLAYEIKQARERREAAQAIEELGGRVGYWPASGGMTRTPVAWVGKLLGEDLSRDVTGIDCLGHQFTDAGLAHIDTDDRLRAGQPTIVNDRNPQSGPSAGSKQRQTGSQSESMT